MAKRKEDPPASGSPAWMATFSDLMNLLLCFFVLLFSMSSTDTQKFQEVMASIQSSFSILPSGGSALDEGILISSGVSQLSELSEYYTSMGMNSDGETETDTEKNELEQAYDTIEAEKMEESQQMAEEIEEKLGQLELLDSVEVVATSSYVALNLNGGILFDSGKDELKPEAVSVLDKIGTVLLDYDGYMIEVVGHTDNVPIKSEKYPDNRMLSMWRAYSVYKYLIDQVGVDPYYIKSTGRGEDIPIADNSTAEGRAQNRRVEIKIYNSFTTN
ncbi:MAG: flagellar motor protein MotB [Thermoflexaceae bacterium]|nr:flagellar motor protein MotB [Thermoflexaceae bacterium]